MTEDWKDLKRGVVDTIAESQCWWTISGIALLDLLRRAHAGENPDSLYVQEYLSAETEYLE